MWLIFSSKSKGKINNYSKSRFTILTKNNNNLRYECEIWAPICVAG